MSQPALYRTYRPSRFSDVKGQQAAVAVLRQSVKGDCVSHAYLFSGSRGCGKTSVARILAKSLNCEQRGDDGEPCNACSQCRAIMAGDHLDVTEIDGASNRGIDEVRELTAHVSLSPFKARVKVYIIDEVHMLTDPAFNALLKTLEEPPAHVVFILATTEPHKVPITIRSRCQHIPFHRMTSSVIEQRLGDIADAEGFSAKKAALREIARQADGAMREAISLLERASVLSDGEITQEDVDQLLGGCSRKRLEKIVSLLRSQPQQAFCELEALLDQGASLLGLLDTLFLLLKDLWVVANWGDEYIDKEGISEEEETFLQEESVRWSAGKLWEGMNFCAQWLPRLRKGFRGEAFLGLLVGTLGETAETDTETDSRSATLPRDEDMFEAPGAKSDAETDRKSGGEGGPSIGTEQERGSSDDQQGGFPREDFTGQPSAMGQDFWKKLKEECFPAACALVRAQWYVEDSTAVFAFPSDARFAQRVLVTPQYQERVVAIATQLWGTSRCVVSIGDASQELHGSSQRGETPPAQDSQAPHAVDAVDPRAPASEPLQQRDQDTEGPDPNQSSPLHKLLAYANGEVLLLRDTENRIQDTTTGESAPNGERGDHDE